MNALLVSNKKTHKKINSWLKNYLGYFFYIFLVSITFPIEFFFLSAVVVLWQFQWLNLIEKQTNESLQKNIIIQLNNVCVVRDGEKRPKLFSPTCSVSPFVLVHADIFV
jgi:hypothetical protein